MVSLIKIFSKICEVVAQTVKQVQKKSQRSGLLSSCFAFMTLFFYFFVVFLHDFYVWKMPKQESCTGLYVFHCIQTRVLYWAVRI